MDDVFEDEEYRSTLTARCACAAAASNLFQTPHRSRIRRLNRACDQFLSRLAGMNVAGELIQ
jgi:hypothetical protein